MKNKALTTLIIVSLIGCSVLGLLINRQSKYNQLVIDFQELLEDYEILIGEYEEMSNNYSTYSELLSQYTTMKIELNIFKNYIKSTILPIQYSIFAEAVRRYYMPLYLDGLYGKSLYSSCADYLRNVVLHDSKQKNVFTNVSNAFSDSLYYGSNTMNLASFIMSTVFRRWIPNWDGRGLLGDELSDIDSIIRWSINELDYEYDTVIIDGQDSPTWDYFKFPVETAFRTMGDCEDQAVFVATYLESCGFETAIAVIEDSFHPTQGTLRHASLLVHIENTTEYYNHYSASLWNLGDIDPYTENTWCWVDTTWDIPFGNSIPWVVAYDGFIPTRVLSIAICDI